MLLVRWPSLVVALILMSKLSAATGTSRVHDQADCICQQSEDQRSCWLRVDIDNHFYGSAKQHNHHTLGRIYDNACSSISDTNLIWDGFKIGSELPEDLTVMTGTLQPTPGNLTFKYGAELYDATNWQCVKDGRDTQTSICWHQFSC